MDRLYDEISQKAIRLAGTLDDIAVHNLSQEKISPSDFSLLAAKMKVADLEIGNCFVLDAVLRAVRERNNRILSINKYNIDELVNNGKEFYRDKKDSNGKYIGLAVALQNAIDEVGLEGIATMPYLIAGISKADANNYLRQRWHTAFSEEYAGIDKNGRLAKKGENVVIVMHGGGILTPNRIFQAYDEGLTEKGGAKLTEPEFEGVLNGTLPSGERINLYTIDDVKRGILNPFGRYAVWMPVKMVKLESSGYISGYISKNDFMNNGLVIARAGTLEYLETYFEKAQHQKNHNVGNWHRFGEIDFRQPQGRVLCVNNRYFGLDGSGYLSGSGRFVGVAPEAQRAKIFKRKWWQIKW